MQVLIAIDQLVNAIFGGWADESISARAYRSGWKIRQALINAMFFDANHCLDSYLSERRRSQLPPECRQ